MNFPCVNRHFLPATPRYDDYDPLDIALQSRCVTVMHNYAETLTHQAGQKLAEPAYLVTMP